jgi:hypothetical protein
VQGKRYKQSSHDVRRPELAKFSVQQLVAAGDQREATDGQ